MQMETADVLDKPLRVLIVDDEPELRKLLKEIAERWKWEPILVSRARDAFDQIRRGDIDIMLLDIQMPVVSGLGLVKAMKRHRIKVPTVNSSVTFCKSFIYNNLWNCV